MPKLDEKGVRVAMATLPDWERRQGQILRTWEFADFKEALAFVNRVGRLAEKVGHHPDIDIRWNKVRLALVSHSEGGLTEQDFALAHKINQLLLD
jgi:4a-hydroxytetrahydrobiopterin dehydratase